MGDNVTASTLLRLWSVTDPLLFVFLAFVMALVVRLLSSLLRAIEIACHPGNPYWPSVWESFRGVDPDPKKADYWFPYILGVLEFIGYPVLMAVGAWTFIGAWLGFKTVAQWKYWGEHRPAFNRFLILNAFVVFLALTVLTPYVRVANVGVHPNTTVQGTLRDNAAQRP